MPFDGSAVHEEGRVVGNRDVNAAWDYHNATKHSYRSVRDSQHTLDFSNYPLPFKIYETLQPIPLPRDASPLQPAVAGAAV